MFSKLFNKKLQIIAPITGKPVLLNDVPDPVFSEKMMGEGIAILPEGGNVLSPVDGKVILIADTKHAIGIQANEGTELLIHIGLETVTLKGEGFECLVKEGDHVSIGQPLIKVYWEFLKNHAESIVTPIVITNGQTKTIQVEEHNTCKAGDTILMTISSK
jgi:PTS system glucose-specific IIA component